LRAQIIVKRVVRELKQRCIELCHLSEQLRATSYESCSDSLTNEWEQFTVSQRDRQRMRLQRPITN
jgi:hypothetical protein